MKKTQRAERARRHTSLLHTITPEGVPDDATALYFFLWCAFPDIFKIQLGDEAITKIRSRYLDESSRQIKTLVDYLKYNNTTGQFETTENPTAAELPEQQSTVSQVADHRGLKKGNKDKGSTASFLSKVASTRTARSALAREHALSASAAELRRHADFSLSIEKLEIFGLLSRNYNTDSIELDNIKAALTLHLETADKKSLFPQLVTVTDVQGVQSLIPKILDRISDLLAGVNHKLSLVRKTVDNLRSQGEPNKDLAPHLKYLVDELRTLNEFTARYEKVARDLVLYLAIHILSNKPEIGIFLKGTQYQQQDPATTLSQQLIGLSTGFKQFSGDFFDYILHMLKEGWLGSSFAKLKEELAPPAAELAENPAEGDHPPSTDEGPCPDDSGIPGPDQGDIPSPGSPSNGFFAQNRGKTKGDEDEDDEPQNGSSGLGLGNPQINRL